MSAQIVNYECPNCLAGLRFDGTTGKMRCDSCETLFEVAEIEQMFREKEHEAAAAGTQSGQDIKAAHGYSAEEASALRSYTCPSCAAELICEATTAATSCPYCGNPTVVPGQFKDELRPDCIIPFAFDKQSAVNALQQYYKGKRLLPKRFKQLSHIAEIKGVYVPFWLFDARTDSSIHYQAEKVHSYRQGNYRVTDTDHYRIIREGSITFEKVPVDASSKMPNAHMDSIEPFDFSGLKPFSTAFLPGFLADKYDESAELCAKRAHSRIAGSTESAFRRTVTGYTTVSVQHRDIRIDAGETRYALMPVWLLLTKWNGKDFLFAMNGQTGELVGDLPVDAGRFLGWLFAIAVPIAAVIAALLFIGGGVI